MNVSLCIDFPKSAHKLGCLTLPLLTVLGVQSCSTVENGRCKPFTEAKYVASSQDTDGKKWQLLVTPEVVDLKCDKLGASGDLEFTAIVLDGQGFAKPAVAITNKFIGSSQSSDGGGFAFDKSNSDSATDSCGTAVFTYKWTCPGEKKSTGGLFYATSGPLASKPVKVTLEHVVQQDQVITK